MDTNDPLAEFIVWYKTRPIVTKTFITSSLVLAIVSSLGYFSIYDAFYTYEMAIEKGEWWRFLTGILYLRSIGFTFIFKAYMAYLVLYYAERDIFERKGLADFLMLLLFSYILNTALASCTDIFFVADPFLFSVLFV